MVNKQISKIQYSCYIFEKHLKQLFKTLSDLNLLYLSVG